MERREDTVTYCCCNKHTVTMTAIPRISCPHGYGRFIRDWSRSRSRSRTIYFSNISQKKMNNSSQPSFTQHPSVDPTEGTGIRRSCFLSYWAKHAGHGHGHGHVIFIWSKCCAYQPQGLRRARTHTLLLTCRCTYYDKGDVLLEAQYLHVHIRCI